MERLRQTLAKFALVATTVTMAMTGFVGTAQATGAITPTAVLKSNDQVYTSGQATTTSTIFFTTVSSAVSKCIQLTWDSNESVTGSATNVYVDWSNTSGGNQVTTGTVAVTSGTSGTVKIPFTGTLDSGRIVTVIVAGQTNGSAATTGGIVTVDVKSGSVTSDCSTATQTVVDTGNMTYSLINDRVTQHVGVARSLSWKIDGNTTHEYRVDPISNPTDTNSNTIGITTNADSYTVYISVPVALTRISGTSANTGHPSTATTGTFSNSTVDFGGTFASPTTTVGGANATTAGKTGFGYNIASKSGSTVANFTSEAYAAFPTGTSTDGVLAGSVATGIASGTTAATAAHHAVLKYMVMVNYQIPQGYYYAQTIYTVTPTYS